MSGTVRATLERASPARIARRPTRPQLIKAVHHDGAAAVRFFRAAGTAEPVLHRHDDPGGRVLDGDAGPRPAGRAGRPVLPRPGRRARHRRLGGRPAAVRHHPALPARPAGGGPDHDDGGPADRAARAPAARPVPGADHADAGGQHHGGAGHGELPERRPRVPRLQRQPAAHPADPPAQHRGQRPGLLPLLDGGRDLDVRAGPGAHQDQAGARLGGDQAERARRAGRGDQHLVLQAVGVRAGVLHHRRRGRRAGRRDPLPVLDQLPDPGLDHAARRDADGRRVQPVGRGDRRVPLPVPPRPAQQLGRLGRLAHHLVRARRAPGADHRAGRAGRPGAQGPGPAAPSAGPPPAPQVHAGGDAE